MSVILKDKEVCPVKSKNIEILNPIKTPVYTTNIWNNFFLQDSNTRQTFIDFYYERVEIRLKNMTPILAGTYTCAAHNPLGTATFTYHVFYKNSKL